MRQVKEPLLGTIISNLIVAPGLSCVTLLTTSQRPNWKCRFPNQYVYKNRTLILKKGNFLFIMELVSCFKWVHITWQALRNLCFFKNRTFRCTAKVGMNLLYGKIQPQNTWRTDHPDVSGVYTCRANSTVPPFLYLQNKVVIILPASLLFLFLHSKERLIFLCRK